MTTIERINTCISDLEYTLAHDFMTEPVRQIITETKTHLETIKSELTSG